MFSTLIKCTFGAVGPSPRLHASSCTRLLRTVAEQGSSWHRTGLRGSRPSAWVGRCFRTVPLFFLLPETHASPTPTLRSTITKRRYKGFARTMLGSALTHGPKLSSLVCLVAACEDVLGLPSSTRMPGPGVTTDPKGQEELNSLPLRAPPTQPRLGLSLQQELSGGPEMALCLRGREAGSSPGTRVSCVV